MRIPTILAHDYTYKTNMNTQHYVANNLAHIVLQYQQVNTKRTTILPHKHTNYTINIQTNILHYLTR